MPVIITIFLLVFVTQLIQWIGKTVLSDFTYNMYLLITRSPAAVKQRQLKTEILKTKQELQQTSAQDQFAKWAKLRRGVDKGMADLEKLNAQIQTSKATFVTTFNTILWALTTGLQFFFSWYYRSEPVFYLPPGWFGPIGYWLSFPWAPAGSVSVAAWSMACRRVLIVFEGVVKAALASRLEKEVPSGVQTPEENGESKKSS